MTADTSVDQVEVFAHPVHGSSEAVLEWRLRFEAKLTLGLLHAPESPARAIPVTTRTQLDLRRVVGQAVDELSEPPDRRLFAAGEVVHVPGRTGLGTDQQPFDEIAHVDKVARGTPFVLELKRQL